MRDIHAFADEFGNNSFKFDTETSHFIVASVIVNHEHINTVNEELEKIRKKHFQTGEIKSQKVARNYKRRIKILNELVNLKFSIFAVIVDKRQLYGEGFKYKKSFYKYINGLVYKELYRTFPKLLLKVDEHGGNDFMKSFKEYVRKNHIRDLFSGSDFEIKKSQNELGVQLADFIAGTLGHIYDETKKTDHSDSFLELIKPKIITINEFPKSYDYKEFDDSEAFTEFDETIAKYCLNRIFDFIDTNEGNSDINIDKIQFLKLLLLYHNASHHKKYTTSKEFLEHLNQNRSSPMNKEYFQRKIISGLRDKGIILASSGEGYKIPTTAFEIKKFIQHGNSIILPMLRRIQDCREALLFATNNGYDILKEPEFERLKELIDEK